MIGVRPISVVGAELEHIDFDSVHGSIPGTFLIGNVQGDLHSNATALFAVGYLPLPVPLLDVHAKAGVARSFHSGCKKLNGLIRLLAENSWLILRAKCGDLTCQCGE